MKWVGESTISKGVHERGFELTCDGRAVPGVLWAPESATAPTPLVLIGHGGGGHKREGHLVSLARRLVRHHGIAAATIDGPVHGDRVTAGIDLSDVRARRAAFQRKGIVDAMVADWKATLDALQKLPELGVARVGYWGLSMGTMFGLPFVASEPRIGVAVLGLMGATAGAGEQADSDRPEFAQRLVELAPAVRCPVLFLQQLEDELIPRAVAADLFDRIGSVDKRLHANPGAHAAVPADEFAHTQEFLARHLV
jgi:dienelactone hydrolase